MNKNYLLIPLCFFFLSLSATAQTEHVVGYCDETLPEASMGFPGGEYRVSAAIQLPREKVMRYQGCKLTKIRFAVKEGFENMSVWVRNSLNTSSKVVQSVPSIVSGWNEVTLNNPYTIGNETLFIGYTATQPDGFSGIMANGEGNEYTSWLAVDNQWSDYHTNDVGILLIQAVVEGDVFDNDLAMMDLNVDRKTYTEGETMLIEGSVVNTGVTTIQGYQLSLSIDDNDADVLTFDEPLAPEQAASFSKELVLTSLDDARHEVVVKASFGENVDENADNDELRAPFFVYTSSYPRMLLLEHFTSILCVNCPPVDKMLEEIVESRDDVAWVSHRVGYREDEFTIAGSRSLTRFGVYGNPYIMIDRTILADNEMPAFTVGSYQADEIGELFFDAAAAIPALLQLQVDAQVEDYNLTVVVNGEGKPYVGELYAGSALHLYLVEDHVKAQRPQAGDPEKKIHDNILRAVITAARGVAPGWTDEGTFEYTTTFNLDPSWNRRNLRVIAFITQHPAPNTQLPTGEVLNATQSQVVSNTPLGIEHIDNKNARTLYYNMCGQLVEHPIAGGIYVVKCNGQTKKVRK